MASEQKLIYAKFSSSNKQQNLMYKILFCFQYIDYKINKINKLLIKMNNKVFLLFIILALNLISDSTSSEVVFLTDDGIDAYKQKAGDFAAKITALQQKTIADYKGKADDVKTKAFNTYKSTVETEVKPFIDDYSESTKKQKQDQKVIDTSKDMKEVQKAKEDLDFHTQRLKIIDNLDESLRNLESNLILELTFGRI